MAHQMSQPPRIFREHRQTPLFILFPATRDPLFCARTIVPSSCGEMNGALPGFRRGAASGVAQALALIARVRFRCLPSLQFTKLTRMAGITIVLC